MSDEIQSNHLVAEAEKICKQFFSSAVDTLDERLNTTAVKRSAEVLGSSEAVKTSKNPRSAFTDETRNILWAWIGENLNDPYPTEEEKCILEAQTGLTRRQINDCKIILTLLQISDQLN